MSATAIAISATSSTGDTLVKYFVINFFDQAFTALLTLRVTALYAMSVDCLRALSGVAYSYDSIFRRCAVW